MKRILIIMLSIGVLNSCNNFDDDLHTNTNLPSVASNTQLLAYAMRSLPGTASSASGLLYAQLVSEAEYITLSRYETVYYNFYTWYTDPLMNIEKVLASETVDVSEGPVANQMAVAKILKAYYFWFMTDRWGDLPYKEALLGRNNFTPAYDTQQDIYNALFILLDEAQAAIVPGAIKNDIVFGGDMTQWKKLANTIHMLMALRLSKIDETKGKTEFQKALSAGVMESNDDNLVYHHLSDANNWNAWYDLFDVQNREWYAVSKPLVNYMLPVEDPRLPFYADTNESGDYVGLDYGLTGDKVNTGPYTKDKVSMLGSGVRQPATAVHLVTYAQVEFAMAEAAKRNWIAGGDATAEGHYNSAIEASVVQWTGSADGVTTLMSYTDVAYDPARALEQIGYQRWVHLFMNGYEAWAEWRRTGFPALTPPADNNGRQIPRREGYPTQEAQNNGQHYGEAVARLGGSNDLNGRVWWDKE